MANFKEAFKSMIIDLFYDNDALDNYLNNIATQWDANNIRECIKEMDGELEPDNIDNIIEEFEKLGYEYVDNGAFVSFEKNEDDLIIIEKNGKTEIHNIFVELPILRLINRILRLWGVEV